MRLVKLGIANINSTVGAFRSNTDKCIDMARLASAYCVTVCTYPEGILGGYSPEDLLDWIGFTAGQWKELERFARATGGQAFPTVHLIGLFLNHQGENYNAVAAVCKGHIIGGILKENLPTYNVFYEGRKCSRGRQGFTIEVNGRTFGDIMYAAPFGLFSSDDCEDIWRADGPLMRHAYSGSELNCTSNASPFRFGVLETRREMLATRAADNVVCQVYGNLVGANDGLIFDGGGFVFLNGKPVKEAPRWVEGLCSCVVDLDAVATVRAQNTTWRTARADYLKSYRPTTVFPIPFGPKPNQEYKLSPPASQNFFMPAAISRGSGTQEFSTIVKTGGLLFEELESALVLGTVDYIRKTKVFTKLGNAGSGGTDSAVTSIIEWLVAKQLLASQGRDPADVAEHLRNGFVTVFSMPTKFNSSQTKSDIAGLCEELGVCFREIPIQDAYERELAAAESMLADGEQLTRVTKQNIQARIRFTRMWNWSNATGGFFPQNGNMSEKAVGYGTIGGGDMDGGVLSIIANLPKTVAIAFLRHLGLKHQLPSAVKIANSIPSAELEDNQEDERDLMPYPVLDACFSIFAGDKAMPLEIYRRVRQMFSDEDLKAMRADYAPGMLKAWVRRFVGMFMRSIFKWVRTPLALHLGSLDLERERAMQLPVVQSLEWLEESLSAIDAEPYV